MKTTIRDLQKEYLGKIDRLDLELLIAHTIKKNREFVLSHPEFTLAKNYRLKTISLIERRIKNEPLAYLVGHKEFFGLDFSVTPDTLIPRPETELMLEETLRELSTVNYQPSTILVDIGTGSGNIIVSVAKATENFKFQISNFKFFGTDISKAALAVAKKNSSTHGVSKKIKFLHGNLLEPINKNLKLKIKNSKMIILANLPYLSKEIYSAVHPTVKKFEPKSALFSPKAGLDHYERLLKQIKELIETRDKGQRTRQEKKNPCQLSPVTCYLEINPEQKNKIAPLIKKYFPKAKIEFKKDLAQKWRLCKIEI